MSNTSSWLTRARDIKKDLIDIRRCLHQYPELAFEEVKTADLVSSELTRMGYEVRTRVGRTGVVGFKEGDPNGFTVALRADMDALPITEETGLSFSSRRPGLMHACGHDAHVACLLGAAQLLADSELGGNIMLIFQPAEESPPGGARAMLEDGLFKELKKPPVAILGLHVDPFLPSGTVALKVGKFMASVDRFNITITGKGGHAGQPHQTIDTLYTACAFVQVVQSVVSRQTDPLESAVITIGKMQAGSEFNVIAGRAELAGTVRTLDEEIRDQVRSRLEGVLAGICRTQGAAYKLDYLRGYPILENDGRLIDLAVEAAREALGEDNIRFLDRATMGGEDFAFYTQFVPGAYVYLGARPADREPMPYHHPQFDIDEGSLVSGAAFLAAAAAKILEKLDADRQRCI